MKLRVTSAGALALLALGSLPGIAAASSQVNGVTVNQLSIYSNPTRSDGVIVYFTPGIPNLEGCSNAAGNALYIASQSRRSPMANRSHPRRVDRAHR